jgi:CheY-like chemotaxis protein
VGQPQRFGGVGCVAYHLQFGVQRQVCARSLAGRPAFVHDRDTNPHFSSSAYERMTAHTANVPGKTGPLPDAIHLPFDYNASVNSIRSLVALSRKGLSMIRALIVDGQDEIRRGLRMRLAIEPDMTIVGDTGKAEEALYLAQALAPDVIVVDIAMRGAEGMTLVRRLRAAAPAPALVVLTLRGDEDTRAQAQEAGVQAFLEKCGGAPDLLQAIRQIAPRKPPKTSGLATRRLAAQRLIVG